MAAMPGSGAAEEQEAVRASTHCYMAEGAHHPGHGNATVTLGGGALSFRGEQEPYQSEGLSVIVLGASGDLAKKKTYPSLLDLYAMGHLPSKVKIVGYARSSKTDEGLREGIRPFLEKRTQIAPEVIDAFLELCTYQKGQYDSAEDMQRAIEDGLGEFEADGGSGLVFNRLFYFAIPPTAFVGSAASISKGGGENNEGWTRLIVEKPFGKDYESAKELCDDMSDIWEEEKIYRIDHYLGKEMVQNLLVLRFANTFLEPVWNRNHVQAVHISFKEDFGTMGRGGYFDNFGMIRDVIQNHLMQVLSLVAMEPPVQCSGDFSSHAIRDAKVNVLQCCQPLQIDDVVLGQYVGNSNGEVGYLEDETVPNGSLTETFCCCVLKIDNPRWDGVPFILTAGKALDQRMAEIRIQFKPVPGAAFMFEGATVPQNELVIEIQPSQEIKFATNLKMPGLQAHPIRSELDLTYKGMYDDIPNPEAYTRLILEVLRGNQAAFVRMDELLQSWKIFEDVLQYIGKHKCEPLPYVYGSTGPREAAQLMSYYGFNMNSKSGRAPRNRQASVHGRFVGPHRRDSFDK